mmetsp:Transcript_34212/g.75888  ORF Transcript_34212/g.75888 Transcript_34212/m.75888 type:complete len:215 (-) Transcript_34212:533-1177(-)
MSMSHFGPWRAMMPATSTWPSHWPRSKWGMRAGTSCLRQTRWTWPSQAGCSSRLKSGVSWWGRLRLACLERWCHAPWRTSAPCAPERREWGHRASRCTIRVLSSTGSSPSSWSRVETSHLEMVGEGSPSTGLSSRMRTSRCAMRRRGWWPWPMPAPTPTGLSSTSCWGPSLIWMAATLSLGRSKQVWTLCGASRRWARTAVRPVRRWRWLTAGS